MNLSIRLFWGSLLLATAITALGTVYFLSTILPEGTDGYAVGGMSRITGVAFFLNMAAATFAAWQGSQLSTQTLAMQRSAYGLPRVAATLLWPLFVALAGTFAFISYLHLRAWQTSFSWAAVGVFILPALVMGGFMVMGFAISLRLPPVIALPVTLATTYLAQIVPLVIGTGQAKLLPLVGDQSACCTIWQEPNTTVWGAPVLSAVALACAAYGIAHWGKISRTLTAIALSAALMAGGAVIATSQDHWRPRSADMACLSTADGALTTCVWPEWAHDLPPYHAATTETLNAWADTLGYTPAINLVTQAPAHQSETMVASVMLPPNANYDYFPLYFAQGLVPPLWECQHVRTGQGIPTSLMMTYVLARAGGMDETTVRQHLNAPLSVPEQDMLEALYQALHDIPLQRRTLVLHQYQQELQACRSAGPPPP